MKSIRLAFSRLRRYFEQDKLVFVLYLLGSVVCSLTFLFMYGNLASVKYIQASDSAVHRTYQFSAAEGVPLNAASFDDFSALEKYPVQDILLKSTVSIGSSNRGASISTYLKNSTHLQAMQGRTEFTEDELRDGKPVIIVPVEFNEGELGESIQVNGVEYEIIGFSTGLDFYIPPSCYREQDYPTLMASIVLSQRLSLAENNRLIEDLYERFSCPFVENPGEIYQHELDNLPVELLMMSAIYFLVFLAFTFLMKYMLDRNRYESIVYSIVGASKRKVFKIMLLEAFILSSVTSFLGILLHLSLYEPLFSKLNPTEGLTYQPEDYILVFLFSVLLSCLTLLPFLMHYSKDTLVQSKQGLT